MLIYLISKMYFKLFSAQMSPELGTLNLFRVITGPEMLMERLYKFYIKHDVFIYVQKISRQKDFGCVHWMTASLKFDYLKGQ